MFDVQQVYDGARQLFLFLALATFLTSFVVNMPFGRFTPKSTFLTLDGRYAWILMEFTSPTMFIYTFFKAPFAGADAEPYTLPQLILAGLYVTHYANRAFISPLRSPSRSRSHLIMPVSGACVNAMNGSLLGSYLSSPAAHRYLSPTTALVRPSFTLGVLIWVIGFAGNVLHDEILLDIRRNAAAKGKKITTGTREYYGIPYGWLYRWISYPNYLCEWIEIFGWALAASPLPPLSDVLWMLPSIFDLNKGVPETITPPYIMFFVELLLMLPRAYFGQVWYREKFGDAYPKDRKIVIPFVW